jgi:prepilin-type N-terminal cleavage/methylation domain-containing protein
MKLFPRQQTSATAFTLIEIMVVVAIIGLMAAIGMPSIMRALQKDGMRKALNDVQDVCFTARQGAIVGKQTTSVMFFPQQGRFGVEGVSAQSSVTTTNAHSGKVTGSSLPDGIHFAMLDIFHKDYAESDWARVYFYPDGTSDEAVIVLTGRGQTEKITLDYVTGTPVVSPVNE